MKRIFLFAMLLSPVLFSCHKDEIIVDSNNLMVGVWNHANYRGNVSGYSRQKDFVQGPGYQFNADGSLIERKISGWCGTPPVSYADYDGNWTILNDTLIQINVGYWGGKTNYTLDVESVTADSLKVSILYESK
jgi:hypothetical protein